jgi:hypothetical protein
VKVQTREMGLIELFLIYDEGGVWEEEWRSLQKEHGIVDQLPSVSKEQVENAFMGWTKPLVNALGPSPSGLLLTLPKETRVCALRQKCIYYRPTDCYSTSKKLPWCFEPEGVSSEARQLAAECVRLWREGVYIVVVREPVHAQ